MTWVMDLLSHTKDVDDGYYRMIGSTVMRQRLPSFYYLLTRPCQHFQGKNLEELDFDSIPINEMDEGKEVDQETADESKVGGL